LFYSTVLRFESFTVLENEITGVDSLYKITPPFYKVKITVLLEYKSIDNQYVVYQLDSDSEDSNVEKAFKKALEKLLNRLNSYTENFVIFVPFSIYEVVYPQLKEWLKRNHKGTSIEINKSSDLK